MLRAPPPINEESPIILLLSPPTIDEYCPKDPILLTSIVTSSTPSTPGGNNEPLKVKISGIE